MRLQFQHGDALLSLEVERDGDGWKVTLPDGIQRRIAVIRQPDDILMIEEISDAGSTQAFRIPFAEMEDGIQFSYGGMNYRFQPYTGRTARKKIKAASGVLTAPMSGIVVDLLVVVGDTVEPYQPLAVIEAMKIMSTLEAPFAGTVKAIYCQPKQQVAHGSPVIEIAPLAEHQES